MKKKDSNRSIEQEAVITTIVGGRPPGSGTEIGAIPRGIEVLLKKASVDAEFRKLLLEQRAEAAGKINLELTPAEVAMLSHIPQKQLKAIIEKTQVKPEDRRVFLGKAAALMLAVLGVKLAGCDSESDTTGSRTDRPSDSQGNRPDIPEPNRPVQTESIAGIQPVQTKGIQPDRPPVSRGISPDRPPISRGIKPDRPKKKE